VHALSAAALTHSVSKACSSGTSAKCGCGPEPSELPLAEFKWGGCSDDVTFGAVFSKWFTNTPWSRRKQSIHKLVNAHNTAVGRKV